MRFHANCGTRITMQNDNLTAIRNYKDSRNGVLLSSEPLAEDVIFEMKIDNKSYTSNPVCIDVGVTTLDPSYITVPPNATKLRNTAWILSKGSIMKDGDTILTPYGTQLENIREGDCLGIMKSSKDELLFFLNGECLGVAVKHLPSRIFAVVDMQGECFQLTLLCNPPRTLPALMCARPRMGSSLNLFDDDAEETFSEFDGTALSLGSFFALSERTADGVPVIALQDKLRFHSRCGILVKLTANSKSAERARPLDDYNNGVVMSHRPLFDNEMFEIRIETLIDKWSGSIEVGVTTHDPAHIRFPSTMTNMDSGTIMMSGSKVLVNGQGSTYEYGSINLDELRVGDTIGMMRRSSGNLHFFINGVDQGIAADRCGLEIWGVIDLYGMTVKVTIVDPGERVDSNIQQSERASRDREEAGGSSEAAGAGLDQGTLLFHPLRDSNVIVSRNGKTAHRSNPSETFGDGVVMTNRTLKTNEVFQVRLDVVVPKWTGSIEIGVTQLTCNEIEFPFKLTNASSGTWALSGEDVVRDGAIVIPQYVRNLNKLQEGDTIAVVRRDMGILHFLVNGVDQGPAAFNVPQYVFGVIDLYGRAAQVSIAETYIPPIYLSPETPLSSDILPSLYSELCFHRVRGRNAVLARDRLVATRTTVYSEFNHAVLFSSRPLRECEMFEIRVDKMIECWIGSIEVGVTAIVPESLDIDTAGTATDLLSDTYILSGSAIMRNGECIRSGYPLDLDTLSIGSRVGIMWHADRSLHFYLDGMDQGRAWYVPHLDIYAVVDLYGQCTQVTILQNEERAFNFNGCTSTESLNARPLGPAPYSFSEYCGQNANIIEDYSIARRRRGSHNHALIFSAAHLVVGEMFEIKIMNNTDVMAGNFRMGITDINILNAHVNSHLPSDVTQLPHYTSFIDGELMITSKQGNPESQVRTVVPSFSWLRSNDRIGLKKTDDGKVHIYYNNEVLDVAFENVPDKVYVVMDLHGSTSSIKALSKLNCNSETLLQPSDDDIKMQESVEEGLIVMEEVNSDNEDQPPQNPPQKKALPFTFSSIHGENITLYSSDTVAARKVDYAKGVVAVSQPLQRGQNFMFRIDKVDMFWLGTLSIGAIESLDDLVLPDVAIDFPGNCWILSPHLRNINGDIYDCDDGVQLYELGETSVIMLHFNSNGYLSVVWGDQVITIAAVPDNIEEIYPVLDLYGRITQISILLYPYELDLYNIFVRLESDRVPMDACKLDSTTKINKKILPRSVSYTDLGYCNYRNITFVVTQNQATPSMSTSQSFRQYESISTEDFTIKALYFQRMLMFMGEDDEGACGGNLDWETVGSSCEYLRDIIKYWRYLEVRFPDLRLARSQSAISCYCYRCNENPLFQEAGCVRFDMVSENADDKNVNVWKVEQTVLDYVVNIDWVEYPDPPPATPDAPLLQLCQHDGIWYDDVGKPFYVSVALKICMGYLGFEASGQRRAERRAGQWKTGNGYNSRLKTLRRLLA